MRVHNPDYYTKLRRVSALLFSLILLGCGTAKMSVDSTVPPLTLKVGVERRTTRGLTATVQLPAGSYRPVFKDGDGIYYRPDAHLIVGSAPQPTGYVFIPFSNKNRQGLWLNGYAVIDWFDDPVPFESGH
jgi:hypothetical protein